MAKPRKIYEEDLIPYLNDYLYGELTSSDLGRMFNVVPSTITKRLNLLIERMDFRCPIKTEEDNKLIESLYSTEPVSDKDLTIGDWDNMTEEQKQKYK